MPDTESIRMIEQTGMRNLIADFGIATTRSELSYAQYPPDDRQHFADFAFVSPEARVVDFRVPRVNISDHLPLVLSLA
jgi:endonuclease/exonuclease/phosphatase family metal-dependent hydrolase